MTDKTTQKSKKSNLNIWMGAGGLMFLVGIAAWITQLRQGIGATSLTNFNAWGIYIAGFVFFMGLSAGSLILGSLPVLFNLPRFRPYAALATFIALISLIVAGLFILVDLGQPARLWRMLGFANLNSPMLWDLLLEIIYLAVAGLFLRGLLTAKSDAGLKPIALAAFLAGLADGMTAFVFATQVGREYWFSAIQPAAFFAAALASAGALLLLLMIVLKPGGYVAIKCCDLNPLAGLTAAAIALGLLMTASEIITLAFTRSQSALALVNVQLASPLFWVEAAAGVAAIALLALPATRSLPAWAGMGAALALAHLAIKRFTFVQMGFAVQNIQFTDVALPSAGQYAPGMVEWGVVTGLVGLFILLFALGLNTMRPVETVKS